MVQFFEGVFVNDSALFVSFCFGLVNGETGKQGKAKKTVKTKKNNEKAKKVKEKRRRTVKNEEGQSRRTIVKFNNYLSLLGSCLPCYNSSGTTTRVEQHYVDHQLLQPS